MKGAIRELRKDARFMANQRLKEQLDRDADRKERVKKLMGQLEGQQADINKEARTKRKKR